MFTIGQAVSTSENDQVKPAGKDYVNMKQCVTSVCMCCDNVTINKKHKVKIYIYIYIYIYN